jgi:hypothetical protein
MKWNQRNYFKVWQMTKDGEGRDLKNDKDVVIAAVSSDSSALLYASEELRNNLNLLKN